MFHPFHRQSPGPLLPDISDLQIALHLAFQVKKAVPRKAVQHMVEKSDAGIKIRAAGAIFSFENE